MRDTIRPEDIDWDEAPLGTHAAALSYGAIERYGKWRRFVGDKTYYWDDGAWEIRHANPREWRMKNPHVFHPRLLAEDIGAELLMMPDEPPVIVPQKEKPKQKIGWW